MSYLIRKFWFHNLVWFYITWWCFKLGTIRVSHNSFIVCHNNSSHTYPLLVWKNHSKKCDNYWWLSDWYLNSNKSVRKRISRDWHAILIRTYWWSSIPLLKNLKHIPLEVKLCHLTQTIMCDEQCLMLRWSGIHFASKAHQLQNLKHKWYEKEEKKESKQDKSIKMMTRQYVINQTIES